jgi:flagellar motor switch protein FliN/FliY
MNLQGLLSLLAGLSGSLASNLSGMLGKNVGVGAPTGDTVSRDELVSMLGDQVVTLRFDLSGNIGGEHAYLLEAGTAELIAGLMMGQDGVELNDAALSALEEAGNTMAGSLVTSLSDRIGEPLTAEAAQTHLTARDEVDLQEDSYLRVSLPLTIDDAPAGAITEVFSSQLALSLNELLKPAPPQQRPAASRQAAPAAPKAGPARSAASGPAPQPFAGVVSPQANVQAVQFPSLGTGPASGGDQGNIGLLMDVYMEMTVELGRTRKLIREILGMGEGTIIELDKLAGEPVDILVNHKLIAKGEVVVIDENFGVRVTEIVSPMDRVSDM